MTYLCILFVSPVYFMMRSQWGPFVLNAILYGMACLFLLSFFGAMFAPFFWMLAVGHAGWHLRKELMVEHAELIATKLAEKLRPEH